MQWKVLRFRIEFTNSPTSLPYLITHRKEKSTLGRVDYVFSLIHLIFSRQIWYTFLKINMEWSLGLSTSLKQWDSVNLSWIKEVKGKVNDIIKYEFEEHIDSSQHPSRFLCVYNGNDLLWYLQFGYFAPNGFKPFCYISNLKNHSSKKGIWKQLMRAFIWKYHRVFLDDNATINGKSAKWYYNQFGFTQLADSNIWQKWFWKQELSSLALLYTRIISSEFR